MSREDRSAHRLPWRQGHKVPRNIYDASDNPIIMCPDEDTAERIVKAVNAWPDLGAENDDAGLAIRCPACGGRLTPTLDYTARAYGTHTFEHRDWTGWECDDCSATWDKAGDLAEWPEWDRERVAAIRVTPPGKGRAWPGGLSDGLVLNCQVCGLNPKIDWHCTDEAWTALDLDEPRGALCMQCFVTIGGDVGAVQQVQVLGSGVTTVLTRPEVHRYGTQVESGEVDSA